MDKNLESIKSEINNLNILSKMNNIDDNDSLSYNSGDNMNNDSKKNENNRRADKRMTKRIVVLFRD